MHVDTMEALGEFDAYFSEALVFVGVALDGILSGL
jgi:hypothetical protein